MPETTIKPEIAAAPETVTGVALLTAEPPTGLRTAQVYVTADGLARVHSAVAEARAGALDAAPGEWQSVTVVYGGDRLEVVTLPVRYGAVEVHG